MKKKRLISLIAAFSLVFTGVTAYVPSGVYAEEMFRWRILFRGRRRSPHPQRTVMDRNMLWMELPQKQFSGILQI